MDNLTDALTQFRSAVKDFRRDVNRRRDAQIDLAEAYIHAGEAARAGNERAYHEAEIELHDARKTMDLISAESDDFMDVFDYALIALADQINNTLIGVTAS